MERKIVLRTIFFNLTVISFILLDLFLPYSTSTTEVLESFYTSSTKTSSKRSPTIEYRKILELKNGNLYHIGRFPEKEFEKGTKIKIKTSTIFNNVNEVLIFENTCENYSVGLFSNTFISILYSVSILIIALNYFYINKIAQILLIAATMFATITSMLYVFYY